MGQRSAVSTETFAITTYFFSCHTELESKVDGKIGKVFMNSCRNLQNKDTSLTMHVCAYNGIIRDKFRNCY